MHNLQAGTLLLKKLMRRRMWHKIIEAARAKKRGEPLPPYFARVWGKSSSKIKDVGALVDNHRDPSFKDRNKSKPSNLASTCASNR